MENFYKTERGGGGGGGGLDYQVIWRVKGGIEESFEGQVRFPP